MLLAAGFILAALAASVGSSYMYISSFASPETYPSSDAIFTSIKLLFSVTGLDILSINPEPVILLPSSNMYSAFLQTDFIIPAFSRIFGSSYFAVYSLLDPSSISTTASYAKVAT